MIRLTLILLAGLFSVTFAYAAGGSSHDLPHEIPWGTIKWQVINLTILFGALTYFLRNTVRAHFQTRRATYLELVSKAETARKEAERNKLEIKEKLAALETAAVNNRSQAEAEARELKQRIESEAKILSEKLRLEAERAIQVEIDRAKDLLKSEVLNQAVEMARESLKSEVNSSEQERLQSEFATKIQAVY